MFFSKSDIFWFQINLFLVVFILKIKKYFNKSPKKKKKLVNYYYFSTRPKILRSTNYQLPTQKKKIKILTTTPFVHAIQQKEVQYTVHDAWKKSRNDNIYNKLTWQPIQFFKINALIILLDNLKQGLKSEDHKLITTT